MTDVTAAGLRELAATLRCCWVGNRPVGIGGAHGASILMDIADRIEALEREVAVLTRELDRERVMFPSEGVWLVERHPHSHRQSRIAKLGELPDPMSLAAVARHTDTIAQTILAVGRHEDGRGVSAMELAEAIVRALADKE